MPSVLIVDDSLTIRMGLAEAFTEAGCTVTPCATLAEAREQLGRGPVDAAILDVLLPDGDGVDLLAEIRATPAGATTPVLMLSTEAEIADRVRALQTGADEYVGKPYDTGYVVAKVRELIRARSPADRGATTVLVIDDSPTFREELRRACVAAGYEVLLAGDGDEGLRLAAVARPNAVIVDGILPGIDGATVIRRIRLDAALRGTPCLLLTAAEERSAELRALDAGADAFVRKQDDLDLTLATLSAVLRRSSTPAPTEDTASLMAPKRILAVDDSLTYLQELAGRLRHEGFDVVMAQSGEEALEVVAIQPVDCILLDMVMSGIGGEETCRRIKSVPGLRDVPVLMLTSLDSRDAMIAALGVGADDYIAKSCTFEVLTARVHAQLRRKQFEDENRTIREELLRGEIEATEARAARELAETRAALVGELELKNRELEAFSYSVSHDLKAPLRHIEGFSSLLLEDHSHQLDDRGQGHLRRVRAAAQRMGELIDDLLQLSRVGLADLEREKVDLSAIARKVADDLVARDPDRQVAVEIEDDIMVNADRRLITVVMENLMGNAWKFTAHIAEPRIEVGATTIGGELAYVVRDNGPGFDMKYAHKLFEPFQRLHAESEFAGTGIGLATVRRVIDRHHGRVWAEAVEGCGATFLFTLPEGGR